MSIATNRIALWASAFATLFVVGALYWQTLRFGFIWDDIQIVYGRVDYHSPARWLEAVRQPLDFSPNYFRPLALSSLLVQIWIWRDNPAPFHFVNVLLHLLNTILVIALALRILAGRWYGALVGALYGIHPALVESVAFISSRYDLTATLFMLLGLLLSERWDGKARAAGVGIAFLLALLCKEMVLTFPAVLLLWQIARQDGGSVRDRLRHLIRTEKGLYLTLGAAMLGYFAIRYVALGYLFTSPDEGAQIPAGAPIQHLLLVGRTLATLIQLTLFPFFRITPVHDSVLPVPVGDGWAWVQLAVAGAVLMGVIWLIQRHPQAGWMLAAGLVSLAPVLNLRPLEFVPGVYTAERFLTFPLALFLMGLAVAVQRFGVGAPRARVRASGTAALTVLWGAALLVKTALTLPNWRDSETFWTWVSQASPNSPIGYANLADVYNNSGRFAEALELGAKAIQVDPHNGTGYVNRGFARLNLGDMEGAFEDFHRAVKLSPNNLIAWNNLAMSYLTQGKLDKAEQIVRQHMRGKPPRFMAHQLLGLISLRRLRPDLAELEFQKAYGELVRPQGMAPDVELRRLRNASPWIEASEYWMLQGDLVLAEKLLQTAAQRNPDKVAYRIALARLRILQNRKVEARALLQDLVEAGYENQEVRNLLIEARKQK